MGRRDLRLVIALACACACAKKPPPPVAVVDAAPAATAAPVVVLEPPDVIEVARKWRDATNANGATMFESLYADRVELDGKRMSREDALDAKKLALANHDHDDVETITVTNNRAYVQLESKPRAGKVTRGTIFIQLDERQRITAEGDVATDTNATRKKENQCAASMIALVQSTAEGKATLTATRVVRLIDESWSVQFVATLFDPLMKPVLIVDAFWVDPKTAAVTHMGPPGEPVDGRVVPGDALAEAKVRADCN
jgi:hypothetical protein